MKRNTFKCLFTVLSIGFFCGLGHGQSQRPFITKWLATNKGKIMMPADTIRGNYIFDYDVHWENTMNASDSGTIRGVKGGLTINNLQPEQEYKVWISGKFPSLLFVRFNLSKDNLKEVLQWGDIAWERLDFGFEICSELEVVAKDVPDLSRVTNLDGMFSQCFKLTGIEANWDWDVSKVESMRGTFFYCFKFNGNIGKWNPEKVKNMAQMFCQCKEFNQNINDWNVGQVKNMTEMFFKAGKFNQPLNKWNVANVEYMTHMFYGSDVFNQPLEDWNVSRVINMGYMFNFTAFNQDIGKWDVGNVTNMTKMFSSSPFNQDIGNWNVSKVGTMNNMFSLSKFNQDIGKWDVGNVIDMTGMFGSTPFPDFDTKKHFVFLTI